MWISFHRLNRIASSRLKATDEPLVRADTTDNALDLTLSRLNDTEAKIDEDHATLKIRWRESDGVDGDAFYFGDEAITFRKIGNDWKLDWHKGTGLKDPTDFFEEGTWGPKFRDSRILIEQVASEIESGKLRSVDEANDAFRAKLADLKAKYAAEGKK